MAERLPIKYRCLVCNHIWQVWVRNHNEMNGDWTIQLGSLLLSFTPNPWRKLRCPHCKGLPLSGTGIEGDRGNFVYFEETLPYLDRLRREELERRERYETSLYKKVKQLFSAAVIVGLIFLVGLCMYNSPADCSSLPTEEEYLDCVYDFKRGRP